MGKQFSRGIWRSFYRACVSITVKLLHISFRTDVVNILKQFLLIFTEARKVHSLCLFFPQFFWGFFSLFLGKWSRLYPS